MNFIRRSQNRNLPGCTFSCLLSDSREFLSGPGCEAIPLVPSWKRTWRIWASSQQAMLVSVAHQEQADGESTRMCWMLCGWRSLEPKSEVLVPWIPHWATSGFKVVTQGIQPSFLNHLVLCNSDKVNWIHLMFWLCDNKSLYFLN